MDELSYNELIALLETRFKSFIQSPGGHYTGYDLAKKTLNKLQLVLNELDKRLKEK